VHKSGPNPFEGTPTISDTGVLSYTPLPLPGVSGESIWDITLSDEFASSFYSVPLAITKPLTVTFTPLPPVPLPLIEWEGVTDDQGRYLGFVYAKITTAGELLAMNQSIGDASAPQCFDGGVSPLGDLFFRGNASITAIACETFDLKRSSELLSETREVVPSFFALVNLVFSYDLSAATPMDEDLFSQAVAKVLNIDSRRVVDIISSIVDAPARRRNVLLRAASPNARRQGNVEYREVQFKVLANSQESASSLAKEVSKEKLQAQLAEEGITGVQVESLSTTIVDGSVIPDVSEREFTGLRVEDFVGMIIGCVIAVGICVVVGHFVQKRRRLKVEEEDREEERKIAKQKFLEEQQRIQVTVEPSYTATSEDPAPAPTATDAPLEPELSHRSEEEISAFRAWKKDVRRQRYGSEAEAFAAWQEERTRLRESGLGLLDPPKVKPSAAELEEEERKKKSEERKSRRRSKKENTEKEAEEGGEATEGGGRRKKGSKKETESIEGVTSPTAGTPRQGEGASPASAQGGTPETPVGETPTGRAARKKLKPLGIGSKQVRSMRESSEITEAAVSGAGVEAGAGEGGQSPGWAEQKQRRRSKSPAKGERARSPVGPNRPEEYQEYDRVAAVQQMTAPEGEQQQAAAPSADGAGVEAQEGAGVGM